MKSAIPQQTLKPGTHLDPELRRAIESQASRLPDRRWLIAEFCALNGYDVPVVSYADLVELLKMQETAIIVTTLRRLRWNVSAASLELGCPRTTLISRMRSLCIHNRKSQRVKRKPKTMAAGAGK
jgi:transcriptional regulator of acetoin/glycerol metabolism